MSVKEDAPPDEDVPAEEAESADGKDWADDDPPDGRDPADDSPDDEVSADDDPPDGRDSAEDNPPDRDVSDDNTDAFENSGAAETPVANTGTIAYFNNVTVSIAERNNLTAI
ncbi:MAG TPA: hypothetical protein PLN48_14205 [Lachnospiraceae bacterium]|nr:hypothetical protein [Lachnospiraceae bacterium]